MKAAQSSRPLFEPTEFDDLDPDCVDRSLCSTDPDVEMRLSMEIWVLHKVCEPCHQ